MIDSVPIKAVPTSEQTPPPLSGAGMDRKVAKKKFSGNRLLMIVGGIVTLGLLLWIVTDVSDGRSYQVSDNRIVISTVAEGNFEDFIPVRGRVAPLKTVFLDAIEGGRIDQVLVEDGALLKKGDLIVRLSNSTLQLSVSSNEALVTEQLNTMRTIELQLEQNRLAHKRSLLDIGYEITRLTRLAERERLLISKGNIPQSQLDQTEDELRYAIQREKLTLESQATDARLQEAQLKSLKAAAKQLERNLAFSQQNLDSLNVRAPVDGRLSGFNAEVGQSIVRGGRLGQINDPNSYKMTALIDEFYLARVDIGQVATLETKQDSYRLIVTKLYPQVSNGQFEVDFVFDAEQPSDIRRGQTLQTRLTLGDTTQAIVIPNGAFYQDSGGNWVFVVSPEGEQAIRRTVRLGRRNARYIEVLDGLELGEKVITSPYTSFLEMDRLTLKTETTH